MRECGNIIWLDSADSTNREVGRRSASLDNLAVIAAESQSEGRGQGDHKWISAPSQNLTFSVLLRFSGGLDVKELQKINDFVTSALTGILTEEDIDGVWVKPPNDIWVADRKIAGILIENKLDGPLVRESIVGVGFNVNQTVWPDGVPNPVSLKMLTGRSYDCRNLLERICAKLNAGFERTCR